MMRKPFIKLTAACVLTALALYYGGIQQQAATATAADTPKAAVEPLAAQARHYVDELAVQPQFADWKQSDLRIAPIGPGTHGWLVIVKQNAITVGYLIMHATEDGGYRLGEYGTGSRPPFDEQTLSRSLMQLELQEPAGPTERLYAHPLLAAWQVTAADEYYLTDAASGELLPVQPAEWLAAASAPLQHNEKDQAPSTAKLIKHFTLPSFDPYAKLPWLTKAPLPLKAGSYMPLFAQINKKEQLRYTAELFEGQMLYVWSVVGYNKWDTGQLYLALETGEDGSDRRYIPLPLLEELGRFYR
ncbi:hypothetical protein [Paenibacillus arenilitoris]|uniref:Uncharacterized protein n=1 Tax=Paenibacillus arenilitoris TaxID=2772299 RepID=A0A927H662_9BACL|nr:hypothetical protein [Paenibacillus arenilitoris]MBD2870211.1 hypothetical protein [Paenibacillus arenilitoris]